LNKDLDILMEFINDNHKNLKSLGAGGFCWGAIGVFSFC